jgi:2,3-bisphosphoglycerate-independent phosphoglycerate mutase
MIEKDYLNCEGAGMKYCVLIMDGAADWPVKNRVVKLPGSGGYPNLDKLAKRALWD